MSYTSPNDGRLGNHIFRNIAFSFVAKKHDLNVSYASLDRIKKLGIELFSGSQIYRNTIFLSDITFFNVLNKKYFYNNIISTDCFQTYEISHLIYGYLQEENNQQKIIKANPFKKRYNKNNDCVIHMRLMDIQLFAPTLNYYLQALSMITFDHLYLVTDDNTHTNIKELSKYYNLKVLNFDEINTIQFCITNKHIILSHGSFSALLGYLSKNSNIYYPKYNSEKMWHGDMFSIAGWNEVDWKNPKTNYIVNYNTLNVFVDKNLKTCPIVNNNNNNNTLNVYANKKLK